MGRLVNEQNIIEKNIGAHIERSASEYTRYLESTPTFITYYQRDSLGSTMDKGLDNVEKYVGGFSPIKFRKIENFPLYGIENLNLNLSREEAGLTTSYEGEGVIIPNTIRPYAEDFFTISYIGEIYLFKLTNITNDAIKSKPFYRIEFSLFKKLETEEAIEEQIDGEFTVIFNNIGTEEKAVIKKSDFLTLDYANKLYSKIRERFLKYFYDPKINVIRYDFGDIVLYNRFLNHFVSENKLLSGDYEYMGAIYFSDDEPVEVQFYEAYRTTIYHALENQNPEEMIGQYVFPMRINAKHTAYAHFGMKYHSVNFVEENLDGTIEFFPQAFYGRLKIDNPFTGDEFAIENMVIDHVYGRLEITPDLLDKINKYPFYPNMYSYVFLPIIMYILKDLQNKLLRTSK